MECIKKTRILAICMFMSFLVIGAMAESRKISGTVVDGSGAPLPGVSVQVKGTTIGTTTGVDGKYEFTVGDDAKTLAFSFIGFSKVEKEIGANTTLDATLIEDSQQLADVVVVGYGTTKKSEITGSAVSVTAAKLNIGANVSAQEMIVGRIAGVVVTPGGGAPTDAATIRIRGSGSLSASNDPLIVIDGIPLDNREISGMGNNLATINPSDIETFSFLKDASAAAIYGSRASNGVILITTKKGSKDKKVSVDYDCKFSVGTVAKKIDNLSTDQFLALLKERKNAGQNIGSISGNGASTNWQDKIFQNAFGQDHNVGVSMNIKNVPIRFSLGYTDQAGILRTSEMKRTTSSLNISPSFLNNHLTVTIGAKGTYSDNRFAERGATGAAVRMDPTMPIFNNTGVYGGYKTWLSSDNTVNVNGTRNPVAQLQQRNDQADVSRIIGDAQVDYKLHWLPELKLTAKVGVDYSHTKGHIVIDSNASWTKPSNSQVERNYTLDRKNQMINAYFNYNKEFKDFYSKVDATGGYEWQHFYRQTEGEDKRMGEYRTGSKKLYKDSTETENYLVSFFGRLNYTLMDKYSLSLIVRSDGSSRFLDDNQWGTFPSVSAAWVISKEPFMKSISSVLSDLKLRAGYGIIGQQDISNNDYPGISTYRISDGNSQYQSGNKWVNTYRPNGFDKNIKWETSYTTNFAIDYGFLNNRINGTIEYYIKKTEDLLNTIPTAAGTNFIDRLFTNVGNIENKGLEFSINAIVIDQKDINWNLGYNISYNKNEITKLTSSTNPTYVGDPTGGIAGGVGSNIQINSKGYPLNSFYVYQQVYNKNGDPIEGMYVDRNKDGVLNASDMYRCEKPTADVLMGLKSDLKLYDFDLSMSFRASIGNYIYDNISSNNGFYSQLYTNSYYQNLTTDIYNTKFLNSQILSDYYIKNASFLKFDNITLGYNFTNLLKPIASQIKSNLMVRAYLTVQNVHTLTNYDGIDPEVHSGIDNDTYPRPRTFLFGLSVKF